MILVNNAGDWAHVYTPLQHADWEGWTPADLIFPTFLFIVGVAITFSVLPAPRRAAGHILPRKVVRRAATIFALGILLNGFPLFDWSVLRIPGVLQRIALCYLAASLLVLTTSIRVQALTAVACVFGYWAVMALVPVPGHPDSTGVAHDLNLAAYIDAALLRDHLLHADWDPEGLLSTIPAIATTLCGVLTGHWLRAARGAGARVATLFAVGNLAIGVGFAMSVWCPINKSLWSSSYVVMSAGVALNALAVCSWLIDLKGWHRWAEPFVAYGTNPIAAYVLSSLLAKILLLWQITPSGGSPVSVREYLFQTILLRVANPFNASLAYALTYVLLWCGITTLLYRNRIVIKV